MKTTTQPCSLPRNFLVHARRVLALTCLLPFTVFAQASSSGSIEGRVFNIATQTYVRNVRIEVVGTTLQAFTDDFGGYALSGVPAGPATLRLFYTGVSEQTIPVNIAAGGTLRRDFTIRERTFVTDDLQTVALDKFVVTETRQMDARLLAINEQRFAANQRTVAASDAFGDSVDGDVASFVKNMPGVALDGGAVSIHGFPTDMTSVTMDGAEVASAAGIRDTRAVSLSDLSLNNIARVEINKTPLPDMPADAAAGSVNLVKRSAFELARPQFKYRTALTFNSEHATLKKTPYPRAENSYKIKPSVDFTYTVPVNKQFGYFVTGLFNQSFSFSKYFRSVWYGAVKEVPATPDNPTLNQIEAGENPQEQERASAGVGADWKFTKTDTLSVSAMFSQSRILNINDYINWQAKGVLNQSKSSYSFDGKEYNQLGRAGVGLIEQRGNHTESGSATSHFVLSYRHDGPVWHANALAYYSKSIRRQGDMKEDGMMENVTLRKQNLTIDYLHVTGGARAPTVVAKTATGAIVDGFSLNDMTMGELTSRDNRNTDELRRGIKANVRRSFRGAVPVTVKSGFDLREQTRDHDGPTRYWTFVGPDGRANTADDFASLYDIRMVNITSPGWGFPVRERVDNWKTYQLFRAHPEYFLVNDVSNIQSAAKESFYLKESIRAGYLMADVSMAAKRLRIVGGIRYEETRNTGIGRYFDPILGYQRDASGNIIRDSKGIPLKIVDPVVYARVTNVVRGQVMKSSYDGLYPSVNATYAVTENTLARVSFSRTLGRPNLSRLFPNTEINDTARTISATSSSLSPWTCDSVDASLEYYFRTGGLVSVGAFRKNIADIFGRITETATPELLSRFDLDPVVYAGYDLTQYLNVGDARVSGMEASFTQDLGPLHPLLKGFSLFANGSVLRLEGDNTADFQGYAPRMGNLGLSYDRSRFNIQLKANYIGRQQRSPREWPNSFEFRMASTKLDLNAQYRITKRLALFVSGRNITNEKDVLHWASPETPAYARLQREMDSGALWSIGVKGEF